MAERRKHYYEVPAGNKASQCSADECRHRIYWIESPRTGNPIPVVCDADDECRRPTDAAAGRGVSHFTTCPAVSQFSQRSRRAAS